MSTYAVIYVSLIFLKYGTCAKYNTVEDDIFQYLFHSQTTSKASQIGQPDVKTSEFSPHLNDIDRHKTKHPPKSNLMKAQLFRNFIRNARRSNSPSYLFSRSDNTHSKAKHRWISPDRILIVELGVPLTNIRLSTFLPNLKDSLENLLKLAPDSVAVYNIHFAMNSVEIIFYNRDEEGPNDSTSIMSTEELMYPDLLVDLQDSFPTLNITGTYPATRLRGMHAALVVQTTTETPIYLRSYFSFILSACIVVIILIVGLTIYFCLRQRMQGFAISNIVLSSKPQSSYNQSIDKHICIYPDLKPVIVTPAPVQPEPDITVVELSPPSHLARVKSSLLERRGSNASLTIDVSSSPEHTRWEGVAPKESSVQQYLQSAGNRLSHHDLQASVNNVNDIYEDFWAIPTNLPEKVCVAGSGTKNRYKPVIPNDSTRVVLASTDKDPLSMYINANYIRGYEGKPWAYIVTQGPMAHTIVDFWTMVWQENVPIIVMITKLKEDNKVKCENYLPVEQGIYGDMLVTIDNMEMLPTHTIRHLTLQKGAETHSLVHFWYTAWPDHKPPECSQSLLDLIVEVDTHRDRLATSTHPAPLLLHCSAGIGRSGCYIAIHIGMQQLREEKSVDIMGLVCTMRMDRGGMVQTGEQYLFIHQALALYDQEYLANNYEDEE